MSGRQGRPSQASLTRSVKDRDKAEQELAISVRKAVSSDETAPKQKHVRVCALFTWDWKTTVPFYNALKMQSILSDEIQCFKALITIHKVMRDGHASALAQTMNEMPLLDAMGRTADHSAVRGYSSLIQSYLQLLRSKLQFHTLHPEFTANMDYEEYRVLRKVDDPNEGYNTVSELMALQDKVDQMQKHVFSNLRPSVHNECRIAALVPLVEESYGIYKFITSMLTALHALIPNMEVLSPLRERYKIQYQALSRFYSECSNLRYLTSLITIPKLPPLPLDFTDFIPPEDESQTPRERTPPPGSTDDLWNSVSSITPEPQTNQMVLYGNSTGANQQQLITQQQSNQMMFSQQVVQHNPHNLTPLEMELQQLRQQNAYAQQLLAGYESRMGEMETRARLYEQRIAEYEQRQMMVSNYDAERDQRDRERDELIRQLQNEIAQWKTKYEQIAQMYAQLRQEHLNHLHQFQAQKAELDSLRGLKGEMERLQAQFKKKSDDMQLVLKERDELRNRLESDKARYQFDVDRFSREAAELRQKLSEVSQAHGQETGTLVAQYEAEKQQQIALLSTKEKDAESLRNLVRDLQSELSRLKSEFDAKNEEVAVLQAGMDQSLLALQNMSVKGSDAESELLSKIDNLYLEHRGQMDQIMDSVLEDCKIKVTDSLYELDSEQSPLNPSVATPSLLLSYLEKLTAISNEFAESYSQHLTSGDTTGKHQATAIRNATTLTQAITHLLSDTKSILSRLITNNTDGDKNETDETIVQLQTHARRTGKSVHSFFDGMKSRSVAEVKVDERRPYVWRHHAALQSTIDPWMRLVESLLPKEGQHWQLTVNGKDSMVNAVDTEMREATETIEEAAQLISRLLSQTNGKDGQADISDSVHQSILTMSKAITDAIARLIICATRSQKEIVQQGRGSGSPEQFYKQNSRWVEGLISAAKAVAQATRILVESADGLIRGVDDQQFSRPRLIVSAQEVSAATVQLVAAARVKAVRGSPLQDRLEQAAKQVTDATRLLVQTVQQQLHDAADIKDNANGTDKNKDSMLSAHEFKKREMEQLVMLLTLEQQLIEGRRRLAQMRREAYQQSADDYHE